MRRLIILVALVCLLLLLLPAAGMAKAKPGVSFDQAIDKLYAQGYPQWIDQHLLTSAGTNRLLGFAWAGTVADDARARWLAAQMRAIGLKNVHLDPVAVDEFTFKWASVTIGGKKMVASTFAGIMPTPRQGVTAEIVYAHEGTAQDFDTLEAAGVSVEGKLVMVDADPINFWMNFPAGEATFRGAAGVIFTYGPATAPYWSCSPDALASFDGCYDLTYLPAVYISQQDGDWVRARLDAKGVGPVATMKLIEKVRLATDGGEGYNVVGDLPGSAKNDDTFVLFAAHHDMHFRAATDDQASVAENMAIAKAMVMSGYKPKHTMRFLITTAEEFGYSDAWNDWCIGAWYQITQSHPEWAGTIRALFNSDYFSGSEPLHMNSPFFAPLLEADAAASPDLLPYGYSVGSVQSTWTDGWTFGAAGVPVVAYGAVPPGQDGGTYHTQYMTMSQVNWPYLASVSKFIFQEADKFTGDTLLPFSLSAQAQYLDDGVAAQDLLDAGADPAAVSRLEDAIAAWKTASAAYEADAGSIPAGQVGDVNAQLLQIEKQAGLALTGMTPFQTTIYPHAQALLDVQSLDGAIAALQADDAMSAIYALYGVDFTYFGTMVSHDVYLQVLHHLDPSYDRVTWGGQANPLWPLLDVMPQLVAIATDSWDQTTIDDLTAMRDQRITDLDTRLDDMSSAVEEIATQIDALH